MLVGPSGVNTRAHALSKCLSWSSDGINIMVDNISFGSNMSGAELQRSCPQAKPPPTDVHMK
jgi:hypothetical protein